MGWHSGHDYYVSSSQKAWCLLEIINSAANSYRYIPKLTIVMKRLPQKQKQFHTGFNFIRRIAQDLK